MLLGISLVVLIASSVVHAENICHKKPPGECEECCSHANQTNFLRAIDLACGRLVLSKENHEVAIKAEINTYIQSETGSQDVELFERSLREHCILKTGALDKTAVSMTYSECSKGCPTGKSSGKRKK